MEFICIDFCRRAHGHTAEEQTQLCRNRLMSVQLLKMHELLENQTHELEVFIEMEQFVDSPMNLQFYKLIFKLKM